MTTLLSRLHRLSTRFDPLISSWGQPLLSLALRCYVAWQFLHAGLLKLQNWQGTLELFHSEYMVPVLPPDLAAVVGSGGEILFPLLLISGLFTRPAAIGLFGVNLMAVISYPQLWEFECPAAINDHFYWGLIMLTIFVIGPGRLSVDHLLSRNFARAVQ